jgi:hypothetical protein
LFQLALHPLCPTTQYGRHKESHVFTGSVSFHEENIISTGMKKSPSLYISSVHAPT